MKIISKLVYQARRHGLDIDLSDGVKIKNSVTGKYIHILPTGRICSEDTLGQDKALKGLMNEFLTGSLNDSVIALPKNVTLHVGNGNRKSEISFAKHCLKQCFANVKIFKLVEDDGLLPSECMVKHEFALPYKERHAFIKACLKYLE